MLRFLVWHIVDLLNVPSTSLCMSEGEVDHKIRCVISSQALGVGDELSLSLVV